MPFQTKIKWKDEVEELTRLSKMGKTFTEMGMIYGVSKQRIKQIFQKYKIEHVGLKATAYARAEAYFEKWGKKQKTELYREQRLKYNRKKNAAKRIGTPFSVSFGELDWPSNCPILGIPLDYFAEGRQENSVSFDRLNPTIGYTKENTRIISWRANRIKNDGTLEEHKQIVAFLEAHIR